MAASSEPTGFVDHFRAEYGPAIATRANAEASGRSDEFDPLTREWNRGEDDAARFELECLLAVGTRA